ncbi:hypothetical protein [Phycicoccus sp. Soil803]|uniref:hypothetical protein n=1 Tax=Phycicoccus sp. Soil803 TaxID=1736415 RepID=UPI00070DDE3B|nr:hypothetical protein [Phycicoccus sp. Soil803]KRF24768.1 hypothetical protein ASG95_09815 [Phycicoccus sp. Soil803]
MTLLLLLLYTLLPAALTCLAWDAKCRFNIINWGGHCKHDVPCGGDSSGSSIANDVDDGDPALRLQFGIRIFVILVGLLVMGEMWTWLTA